jgi:hypothetical protein
MMDVVVVPASASLLPADQDSTCRSAGSTTPAKFINPERRSGIPPSAISTSGFE